MPFNLYSHHQLSELANFYQQNRNARLADYRAGGVLGQEYVVVPTYGVAVWLEHHLVERGMVSAGVDFPMLRPAVCGLLESSVEGYSSEKFSTMALVWRIYGVLGREATTMPEELKKYLVDEIDLPLRRYEFAKVAAMLFEEYQSYLPRTLNAWGRGEHLNETIREATESRDPLPGKFSWQSWLWHRVCNPAEGHLVSLAEAVVRFTAAETEVKASYPLTIFGASAMPPAFLDVLLAYSRKATVNFYYRNPSREYWGDNLAKWKMPASQLENFQNDLLADNAIPAQEFFRTVVDKMPQFGEMAIPGEAEEPEPATLLQRIQQQILDNVNPEAGEKFQLAPTDDSIVIHNCFNATREVEALRDSLLLLLKQNPAYTMNDIIVMAPDISAFAPAIHAVFDNSPLAGRYSLSDRTLRQANRLAEGFLEILQLKDSRYEVSKITQLLEVKSIQKKFRLSGNDVQAIHQWLLKAEIRLDLDGQAREIYHLSDEAYTWQLGLDRLLLALAVEPTEEGALGFADLAPLSCDGAEDSRHALGALCELMRALPGTIRKLTARPTRKPEEWRDLLIETYERYFAEDDENSADHLTLRKCINDLAKGTNDAGFADEIPFSIVMSILTGALESAAPKTPFLQGKITCCSMLPMREVPCKVLAILGMDAGAFPHRDSAQGFTLLARDSKLPYYVRSRVQEDKYIFLEAIQSVSDHLLIFFHGQDDKKPDESAAKLPPAPLVAELLSYIDRAAGVPDGGGAAGVSLMVRHSLNAFDPENFRLAGAQPPISSRQCFSFDGQNAEVANTAEEITVREEPDSAIFNLEIPADSPFRPQGGILEIQLSEVARFFRKPVGDFLVNRMNFNMLYDDQINLEDTERFSVADPLEQWQLKAEIFTAIMNGERQQEVLHRLRRNCKLPLGRLADLALESIMSSFKLPPDDALGAWRNQESRDFTVEFELPSDLLEGFDLLKELRTADARLNGEEPFTVKLHAQFAVSPEGGIAAVVHGDYKTKHFIGPYLEWLVLAANSTVAGGPPFLRILCTKTSEDIRPLKADFQSGLPEHARKRLAVLVRLFILGQFMPLPPVVELNENQTADTELVLGKQDRWPASIEVAQNWLAEIMFADCSVKDEGPKGRKQQ